MMLSVLLNGSVQLLFFQHVYVFVQWSCTCFMEIKCAYLEMYVLMGMCLQYYLNFFMEMTRCISLKMQKKKINTTLLPQSNVPCNIVFVGEKWAMYICFSFE